MRRAASPTTSIRQVVQDNASIWVFESFVLVVTTLVARSGRFHASPLFGMPFIECLITSVQPPGAVSMSHHVW